MSRVFPGVACSSTWAAISPETIDSRVWPRTAAIAERFWSPGHVKDVDDMYRRLDVISLQLEELRLTHEKNSEMILRRLARRYDIGPLQNLVEVVEPVEYFDRMAFHEYTSLTPLSRVVDAAQPDSRVARHFRSLISRYLDRGRNDPGLATEILNRLELWNGNHTALLGLVKQTPALLKAIATKKGVETSFVASATFSVVDSNRNGLRCAYYEGEWQSLPDFAALSPKASRYVYEFSLEGISTRHLNYALEFSGFIKISREGLHTFYANSDDGSRLMIGDTEVVTNDGLHAPLEKEGQITLQAGLHPIKVSFFQAGGGEFLSVEYAGPEIDKQPIPAGVLFRAKPVD